MYQTKYLHIIYNLKIWYTIRRCQIILFFNDLPFLQNDIMVSQSENIEIFKKNQTFLKNIYFNEWLNPLISQHKYKKYKQ